MKTHTIACFEIARDLGLSLSGIWSLVLLQSAQVLTMSSLCGSLGVSTASGTGVVDTLERAGLVRRVRSTTDRREIGVMLTDSARADLAKLLPAERETRVETAAA